MTLPSPPHPNFDRCDVYWSGFLPWEDNFRRSCSTARSTVKQMLHPQKRSVVVDGIHDQLRSVTKLKLRLSRNMVAERNKMSMFLLRNFKTRDFAKLRATCGGPFPNAGSGKTALSG